MKHFILLFASLCIASLAVNAQDDDPFNDFFNDSTSTAPPIVDIIDPQPDPDPMASTGDFVTYTLGGIGTYPKGGNPGTKVVQYFPIAFPDGLTIGYGSNTITLTNPAAVRAFMRSTGGHNTISSTLVNPEQDAFRSTVAVQLAAAKINAAFNEIDGYANSDVSLYSLTYTSGDFEGKSVAELFEIADRAVGGEETAYSLSAINKSLTDLNENYLEGTTDNGNLTISSSATKALILTK